MGKFVMINLETAVQDNKVMQNFDLESLPMGADHSQMVKAAPIGSDYSSKDCVNLLSSTAVSRINWLSDENVILSNPRMPEALKKTFLPTLSHLDQLDLKGHVFMATSGSSGIMKWAALSKTGILHSAAAVNNHLNSSKKDIWLNPLPCFHVGGLGILARGYLSEASVVDCDFPNSKWCPLHFLTRLIESRATLVSLVPTQVFDLVASGHQAPPDLRAVIVGGGRLSEKVYFSAIELGWKLLPSYGLTECASQVATAEYGSWSGSSYPLLVPLSHVDLSTNDEGFLKIKSESLLTGYLENDQKGTYLKNPKIKGWLTTEDQAIFEGKFIKSISRETHCIKIGGENVNILRLEEILEEERLSMGLNLETAIVALEDARLGYRLHLAVAFCNHEEIKQLINRYHERVFPFERISQIHHLEQIPRSPLKKILREELNHQCKNK